MVVSWFSLAEMSGETFEFFNSIGIVFIVGNSGTGFLSLHQLQASSGLTWFQAKNSSLIQLQLGWDQQKHISGAMNVMLV